SAGPADSQAIGVSTTGQAGLSVGAVPAAPLVVYVAASEEQRTLVDAYIQRRGLHAVAYTLHSPDEAELLKLPGLQFASGEQWRVVEAVLHQQREQADQQAITRAMTGQ
ncbi:MAG: hypothetical protein ACYDCQ_17555, partial [Dehalococcoidia bacterium]